MMWSDLLKWNGAGMDTLLDAVIGARRRVATVEEDLLRLDIDATWEGYGSEAEVMSRGELAKDATLIVSDLEVLLGALSAAQDGVNEVALAVNEVQQYAWRFSLVIDDNGVVRPDPSADFIDELVVYGCQDWVTAIVQLGREVADNLRAALQPILRNESHATSERNGMRPSVEPLPPATASTEEVASWWASRTEGEKQQLIREYPDVIGELDGIDAASRDAANRFRLGVDTAALVVKRQALVLRNGWDPAERVDYPTDHPSYPDPDIALELSEADQRLREIAGVQRALASHPDTQLLLFDPATGENGHEMTHAAIAVGDVDTAEHVATFVPGMSTTVEGSIEGMVEDASLLRGEASVLAAPGEVAVVSWIGYDAPPVPWESFDLSVAGTGEAQMGGEALTNFVEGIADARSVSASNEVHQSILGHSYGSNVAVHGVLNVRPGVVGEIAVFGSPGTPPGWKMNVPDGHAFAMAHVEDFVTMIGKAPLVGGPLGNDPMNDPAFTTLDAGGFRWPWDAHSSYFNEGSKSLDNMAKIVAGGV